MKRSVGDHVDVPIQKIHEFQAKPGKVQKRSARLQLDKDVHVAPGTFLASSDGTEHGRLHSPVRTQDVAKLLAKVHH